MEGMLTYEDASKMYEEELLEFNFAIDRYIELSKS